jgi:hypothetical protein
VFSNTSGAYDFLAYEADYYLPDKYFVSLQWMADLIGGTKKVSGFNRKFT